MTRWQNAAPSNDNCFLNGALLTSYEEDMYLTCQGLSQEPSLVALLI